MYRIIISSLFAVFLVACAQSTLTSAWVDRTYTKTPIKSMLVISMPDNLRVRRIFEDVMVQKLKAQGVNAIASSQVYPDKLPSKEIIGNYVKKHNIQTVFVGQLINIEDKNIRYLGNGFSNSVTFTNYYSSSYSYIYDDSYTVSYEFVNIEFTLFDTASHKPIWSTSSESVDPTNINNISDELAGILVSNMKDSHLIN